MRNLYIVIPVFNGWESTKTCLAHLALSTYKNFCVVLVDHSAEGNGQNLADNYLQELDLVCLRENSELWWTGATNSGILWAMDDGAEKIMLLNHDCYVEANAIDILMHQISKSAASILAPEQYDLVRQSLNCRIAYTAYIVGYPTVIPPIWALHANENKTLVRTAMIVGGRGVIIPVEIFKNIGLLDEKNLPHYGSDNDFYMRCKSAGYRLYVSTKARVFIDNQQTTLASGLASLTLKKFLLTLRDRRSHRNIKDQMQLFRKHYPVPGLYPIGVAMNLSRYFFIYLVLRSRYLLASVFQHKKTSSR